VSVDLIVVRFQGVVTVAPDRVHIRFNSADKKRKRKSQQQQQQQQGERQNKSKEQGKARNASGAQAKNKSSERKTSAQSENVTARQKRAENEKRRKEIESDRMMEDDDADAPAPAPSSAADAAEEKGRPESRGERSVADNDNEEEEKEGESEEESVLHNPEECYICKRTFHKVHHFYDRVSLPFSLSLCVCAYVCDGACGSPVPVACAVTVVPAMCQTELEEEDCHCESQGLRGAGDWRQGQDRVLASTLSYELHVRTSLSYHERVPGSKQQ
jgi:hypothetical protein